MLPWSVIAHASMPAARTRGIRSLILLAPSSSEYCVCRCRWTNDIAAWPLLPSSGAGTHGSAHTAGWSTRRHDSTADPGSRRGRQWPVSALLRIAEGLEHLRVVLARRAERRLPARRREAAQPLPSHRRREPQGWQRQVGALPLHRDPRPAGTRSGLEHDLLEPVGVEELVTVDEARRAGPLPAGTRPGRAARGRRGAQKEPGLVEEAESVVVRAFYGILEVGGGDGGAGWSSSTRGGPSRRPTSS